jgi:hypothetical protein
MRDYILGVDPYAKSVAAGIDAAAHKILADLYAEGVHGLTDSKEDAKYLEKMKAQKAVC